MDDPSTINLSPNTPDLAVKLLTPSLASLLAASAYAGSPLSSGSSSFSGGSSSSAVTSLQALWHRDQVVMTMNQPASFAATKCARFSWVTIRIRSSGWAIMVGTATSINLRYETEDPACCPLSEVLTSQYQHAEKVMPDIERNCGTGADGGPRHPAQAVATELLREGNFFDCGRDSIHVSVVDMRDDGQKCVVKYVNENEKAWMNGAASVEGGKMVAVVGVLLLR
jgi:hypothetical protein